MGIDLTQFLAAGGIVGLFGATATVLVQLLRTNSRLTSNYERRTAAVETSHTTCQYQLNVLVGAMQRAGLVIPPAFWEAPPHGPSPLRQDPPP